MKKTLTLFLVGALMATSTVGCAKEQTTNSSREEKTVGVKKADNEKTTETENTSFSFLHFHNEADESGTAAAYTKMADKWTSENSDVTIDAQYVSHDNYETTLRTLMASNTLPDVFLCKGDTLTSLADAGLIVPVQEDIESNSIWYNGFNADAFSDGTYKETIYGIPFQLQSNTVVTYNKEIFTECGVDKFPENYDELLDAIQKIKAKGYIPIALGNKARWVAGSCLFNTFAYRYVDVDWFNSLKEGTGAKFTDEAFIRAVTDFQNLATVGAFNEDMNSIDNLEQKTLFYNKKAAMFIEGAWSLGDVIANAPDDVKAVTGFANLPKVVGAGGNKDTVAGGSGWQYVINASLKGEAKKKALSFIEAITGEDYGKVALEMGFVSASNVDASSIDLNPLFKKYLELNKTMNFAPIFDVQLPGAVGEELFTKTQELLIGAITPQQMAEECQAVMDAQY